MPGVVETTGSALPAHKLIEGMTALFKAASSHLPVTSLCAIRRDGPDDLLLTHADAFGTSGHRVIATEVSPAFRPGSDPRQVTESELQAHRNQVVEARLLMSGSEGLSPRTVQAAVVPIPEAQSRAILIAGLSTADALTVEQIAGLRGLADDVWHLLNQKESAEEELARLRRVNTLEAVLPALVEALDIRAIFGRVSELAKNALAHDFLSIGTFNEDRTQVRLHAQTADWRHPEEAPVQFPPVLVTTFTEHLVEDLRSIPLEEGLRGVDFGAQSSLRVPVRVNGRLVAALNFSSRRLAAFGSADVAIAQLIAQYMALALSHQQLAEESRRASALQERETNLRMLDGLLSTLAGVLDVRDVFARVSEIAKQVLPHDLMGLPLFSKDGNSLIVHAVVGTEPTERPLPLTAMHRRLMVESWDHLVFE